MALENLRSALGPTNKKGKKGTGELFDTFGFENVEGGVSGARSKYQTTEKVGKKPKGPDTGGNIPGEKLAGH